MGIIILNFSEKIPSFEIGDKQAKLFFPSMFIAQLPQMPSRQERRKVKVGSISF